MTARYIFSYSPVYYLTAPLGSKHREGGGLICFVHSFIASPRPGLAQGGFPERICRMNKELNEARGKHAFGMASAWGGEGQVGAARNDRVLNDQVRKGPGLLAKGVDCILRTSGSQ